ncbi:SDR family NAD(P)-dependent oxidoreductase [Chloroflexota bacterium]
MGRLNNKVAIITGGGGGMGRAAAILFAKEGAQVVVAERYAESGEETVRMIKEGGGEAVFVETDVSKTADVKRMVDTAINAYGGLHILYNNAAILGELALTTDQSESRWDEVMDINLKGVWLGMKYAIPKMIESGGGSIINAGSQAAERGNLNLAFYSASKGGVLAMSRVTAMEYAKQNIRVNCINPGIIWTPMNLNNWSEEQLNRIALELIPQGRLGDPEEVAKAALFLASDESSHVTGHVLVVDGGMEARA